MKINNVKYLSLPQQVQKNQNDIEELRLYLTQNGYNVFIYTDVIKNDDIIPTQGIVQLEGKTVKVGDLILGRDMYAKQVTHINPVSINLAPEYLEFSVPGPQGPEGPQGPQGPQGLQGIIGPKGASGEAFDILMLVDNPNLLPNADETPDHIAYLVEKDTNGIAFPNGNHLFFVLIDDDDIKYWYDNGPFNGIPGPIGPEGPQGEEGERGSKHWLLNVPLGTAIQFELGNIILGTDVKVGDLVLGTDGLIASIISINESTLFFVVSDTRIDLKGPEGPKGEPGAVELTQAQYDALSVYDDDTYYMIVEE